MSKHVAIIGKVIENTRSKSLQKDFCYFLVDHSSYLNEKTYLKYSVCSMNASEEVFALVWVLSWIYRWHFRAFLVHREQGVQKFTQKRQIKEPVQPLICGKTEAWLQSAGFLYHLVTCLSLGKPACWWIETLHLFGCRPHSDILE